MRTGLLLTVAATAIVLAAVFAAVVPAASGTGLAMENEFPVDHCPPASAMSPQRPPLQAALPALYRRAAVVFKSLMADPISPTNTSVQEAILLPSAKGGVEAARWYRIALQRCGRHVAGVTWAFDMSFTAHANAAEHIAFLVHSRDGWRLYWQIDVNP